MEEEQSDVAHEPCSISFDQLKAAVSHDNTSTTTANSSSARAVINVQKNVNNSQVLHDNLISSTHMRKPSASSLIISEQSFRLDSISVIRHSAQVHDEPGNSMRTVDHEQMVNKIMDTGNIIMVEAADAILNEKTLKRAEQPRGGAENGGRISCGRMKLTLFGGNGAYWLLMGVSSTALVLGLASATLLGRLYFVNGGSQRWLYTWVESTGWPILLPPLGFCYWKYKVKPARLTPIRLLTFLIMGCLTALTNLLYSWGLSYLPVSTNSLLCSSQLVFNAIFSYALVGHRITSYVLNSIIIITMATILLAVQSSGGGDRPKGITHKQYILGCVVTVVASALFALTLPLLQLIYKSKRILGSETSASFTSVMEVQVGIQLVASVFSFVGMWAAGNFQAMREEALAFEAGNAAAYINTLIWCAVGWQLYLLGGVGIIFLASSLLACSFMTAMIPVLPVLAVVFFHDSFSAAKGIAMALSVWGFLSYLYGGYLADPVHSVDTLDC